jgi:SNF2 family DNA or RNA helicase
MEVLEEISGKVIIWATYVHDIERIVKSISEVYGPETVVHYYGKTSDDDRSEAKIRFQNDKTTRFFVGNPSTGRYSLTLTAASNVVYYSNSYDLEHRVQSEDRAHRKGQTEKVTYIDLVIRNTMDEVIYKSLKMKKNIAAGITGDELREWLKL